MKRCSFCAESIQDEAVLCRFCGKEQPQETALPAEVVLFEGSPLHRAYFWSYVGLGILCVVLVGIPLVAWRILATRAERYRITTRRIERQTGVLSQTVEALELWRVRDLSFRATLWDRMIGLGRVVLTSQDVSTPVLEIRGLPNARTLFARMLDAVEESRKRAKVTALSE